MESCSCRPSIDSQSVSDFVFSLVPVLFTFFSLAVWVKLSRRLFFGKVFRYRLKMGSRVESERFG